MKISPIEVTYIDHCGSDISVVNAARVSFHKESEWEEIRESGVFTGDVKLPDKDVKLINYLAKHKHHSPFNHAFISVRVKAPIFVARQLVKHKFMPWNEVSRRYVDDEPEFYIPDTWRAKAENAKQGSGEDLPNYFGLDVKAVVTSCLHQYHWMLEQGVAPEQARMVLPQNTMTEWYWSGTLGAFGDMLKLRLDPHTQKETRDVAELIKGIVEPLFPVSLKAMLEN